MAGEEQMQENTLCGSPDTFPITFRMRTMARVPELPRNALERGRNRGPEMHGGSAGWFPRISLPLFPGGEKMHGADNGDAPPREGGGDCPHETDQRESETLSMTAFPPWTRI